jgi:phage replication-related protein YjqB (UPF0714/DUF867 family)
VKIEIQGLDKFLKEVKDFERRAMSLHGKHQVSFEELFSGEFMRKYTDFRSIAEMLEASGYKVETAEDFEKIPDVEWDTFVSKRTRFANWEEMQGTAVEQYSAKKLGF